MKKTMLLAVLMFGLWWASGVYFTVHFLTKSATIQLEDLPGLAPRTLMGPLVAVFGYGDEYLQHHNRVLFQKKAGQ